MDEDELKEYCWKNELFWAKRIIVYLSVFGVLFLVFAAIMHEALIIGNRLYIGFLLVLIIPISGIIIIFLEDAKRHKQDFPPPEKKYSQNEKTSMFPLRKFLLFFLLIYMISAACMLLFFQHAGGYNLYNLVTYWGTINAILCTFGLSGVYYIARMKI